MRLVINRKLSTDLYRREAMENYLEIYARWYPNSYGLQEYPRETSMIYTNEKRSELAQKLTSRQRMLVEKHRKYLFKSLFLRKQFLKETEWDFIEFRIDDDYPNTTKKNKLYCQCGRQLKYQFIVQSTKTNRKMKLGITHFSDHLKISPKVANEIKLGVNAIDIALDELLYLIDKKYKFPEDLWRRYCIAHYRNNTLNQPVPLNLKLMKRVLEFRECDMPIFTSDYRLVLEEISKVNKVVFSSDEKTFINSKTKFEKYSADLNQNGKNQLLDSAMFLSEEVNLYIRKGSQAKKYDKSKIVDNYVRDFTKVLSKLERNNESESKQLINQFIRRSSNTIDKTVTTLIYKQFMKYSWEDNFYLGIPKIFRARFFYEQQRLEEIEIEKNKQIEIKRIEAEKKIFENDLGKSRRTEYNASNTENNSIKTTQDTIFERNLEVELKEIKANQETVEIKRSSDSSFEEIVNLRFRNIQKEKVFFEFLYTVLFLPKNISEQTISTMLDLLFDSYDINNWKLAYKLLEARNHYFIENDFDESFCAMPEEIYRNLEQEHSKRR